MIFTGDEIESGAANHLLRFEPKQPARGRNVGYDPLRPGAQNDVACVLGQQPVLCFAFGNLHAGGFVGGYVLKDAEEFHGAPLSITRSLSHCANDPLIAIRGARKTQFESVTLSGSYGFRHKPDQHRLVIYMIGGNDGREVRSDGARFETMYPVDFVRPEYLLRCEIVPPMSDTREYFNQA